MTGSTVEGKDWIPSLVPRVMGRVEEQYREDCRGN